MRSVGGGRQYSGRLLCMIGLHVFIPSWVGLVGSSLKFTQGLLGGAGFGPPTVFYLLEKQLFFVDNCIWPPFDSSGADMTQPVISIFDCRIQEGILYSFGQRPLNPARFVSSGLDFSGRGIA